MSGGWAVCPVCGAVVADTWEHAAWHETRLADLIVDVVDNHPTGPTAQDTAPDAVDAPDRIEETS